MYVGIIFSGHSVNNKHWQWTFDDWRATTT